MPTCTNIINALEVLASAIPAPNVIVDLSGQIATITDMPEGTLVPIELTAGGQAALSVPSGVSIDGKLVKMLISGRTHLTTVSGYTCTCGIWYGSSSDPDDDTSFTNIGGFTSTNDSSFYATYYFYWDSTTQKLMYGGESGPTAVFQSGVASQSDISFVLFGEVSPLDTSASVTVDQWRLEFA